MDRFQEKDTILLVNLNPPYGLHAHTLALASPGTLKVRQVIVRSETVQEEIKFDDEEVSDEDLKERPPCSPPQLALRDLWLEDDEEYDEIDDNQKEQENRPETPFAFTEEALDSLFGACHTIILPDSLLLSKSRVMAGASDVLLEKLIPALQRWIQNTSSKSFGSTLVVQCLEGIRSASAVTAINKHFFQLDNNSRQGWKLHVLPGSADINTVPTKRAKDILGIYVPSQIQLDYQSPFVLECGGCENNDDNEDETPSTTNDGLYQIKVCTREEFEEQFNAQDEVFDRLGMPEDMRDPNMTCFDVEKSWIAHLERYSGKYSVAMRGIPGGGPLSRVVWFGDRGQQDRRMSYVFCRLLNLAVNEVDDDPRSDDATAYNQKKSYSSHNHVYLTASQMHPGILWLGSLAVVILAILVNQLLRESYMDA